jgi:hypothetical protein
MLEGVRLERGGHLALYAGRTLWVMIGEGCHAAAGGGTAGHLCQRSKRVHEAQAANADAFMQAVWLLFNVQQMNVLCVATNDMGSSTGADQGTLG